MKLTKHEMAIMYQIILDSMSRVDRKTPVGYVDDLQKLEIKFSNYYDRIKSK